jgi:transposase
MIQLTPQMRILVGGVEAVDFRKGIDGLVQLCREVLAADPFSGWLFVFRSRRQTPRILVYDGQGGFAAHEKVTTCAWQE